MSWVAVILLATLVAYVSGSCLFPHGSSAGDHNLGATDDGSATMSVSVAVKMYGRTFNNVRVSMV